MNSRLLPQNKASFGSDQLVRFRHFTRKNLPKVRALFIMNGGCHWDEEVESNLLTPSLTVKMAREQWSITREA